MSIDPDGAARWLEAYVEAWKSYDPNQIAELFSEDVELRYHPYDEPIVGREAVVASWLGEGENAPTRDAPGTYDASYLPVAIDGDHVVATGVSTYSDEPGGPPAKIFHNCFVMRFDSEQHCSEFTEWFMQAP